MTGRRGRSGRPYDLITTTKISWCGERFVTRLDCFLTTMPSEILNDRSKTNRIKRVLINIVHDEFRHFFPGEEPPTEASILRWQERNKPMHTMRLLPTKVPYYQIKRPYYQIKSELKSIYRLALVKFTCGV